MDLTTAVTAATGSIPAISAKTPDADAETPAPRIHPLKTVSSTNGVLKRHHPYSPHHRHVSKVPPAPVITYRDCLKNHAASLGGYAVDGCGEFMPSPSATPSDPTSLKCAACGCHRNFHRRDPEEVPPPPVTSALQVLEFQPHHRHHPPPPPAAPRSPDSQSPPPISSSYYPSAPHMLLALSAGLSGHPENPNPVIHATPTAAMHPSPNGRKRFRTKFTPGQKEKMHHFAERVGWKMQKKDEDLVSQFCSEVGVERNVLKVWMHNNKNTLGRRDFNPNSGGDHLVDGGERPVDGGDDEDDDEDRHHRCPSHSDPNNNHHHHLSGDLSTAPFGTNASSSSS